MTSVPLSYVTTAYATNQDLNQPGSYWTTMNGVPIGCDVPDNNNGKSSLLPHSDVNSWIQSLERDRYIIATWPIQLKLNLLLKGTDLRCVEPLTLHLRVC